MKKDLQSVLLLERRVFFNCDKSESHLEEQSDLLCNLINMAIALKHARITYCLENFYVQI